MNDKYWGWTNRETWLVNLWFGDSFSEYDMDVISPDYVRETVTECAGEHDGFLGDIVSGFLGAVNWAEIAQELRETA